MQVLEVFENGREMKFATLGPEEPIVLPPKHDSYVKDCMLHTILPEPIVQASMDM